MLRTALSVGGTAVILSCSPSSTVREDGGAAEPQSSYVSSDDPTRSADAAARSATTVEAEALRSTGRSTSEQVPLTPGVYVLAGTACKNPPNAAWRVWDGKSLSGSSTRACRATITAQRGDTYTLRNSCENTYHGSRDDETLAMTVTDQVHFSLEGQAFESCSMAQVPEELRRKVTG